MKKKPTDEIWVCVDGRELRVDEMSEEHVRSALRMVIRNKRRMRDKLGSLKPEQMFAVAFKLLLRATRERQEADEQALLESLENDDTWLMKDDC